MRKSEWNSVCVSTDKDKADVRSWFKPLCDDMTPEKAEILCDVETDKEKKLRALMIDKDGQRRWAIRTLGKKTYSVTLKAAEAANS